MLGRLLAEAAMSVRHLRPALQGIEASFLARELSHGKVPAFVELLKFKVGLLMRCKFVSKLTLHDNFCCPLQTCNIGARVWGVVSDVVHHGLTVSLADGLKGYVSVEEVQSPPLPPLWPPAIVFDCYGACTFGMRCIHLWHGCCKGVCPCYNLCVMP